MTTLDTSLPFEEVAQFCLTLGPGRCDSIVQHENYPGKLNLRKGRDLKDDQKGDTWTKKSNCVISEVCGKSSKPLFEKGYSVWKKEKIGTIFYKSYGLKTFDDARHVCRTDRELFQSTFEDPELDLTIPYPKKRFHSEDKLEYVSSDEFSLT